MLPPDIPADYRIYIFYQERPLVTANLRSGLKELLAVGKHTKVQHLYS